MVEIVIREEQDSSEYVDEICSLERTKRMR